MSLMTVSASAARFALCGVLALVPAFAAAAEPPAADGLVPVKLRNFDKAWERPGSSLAGYSTVLIKPATVAFSKHWDPRRFGTFGMKPADVERVRSGVAEIANETLAKVLSDGGYQLASAPGPGVLEVQPDITDLYVNAPEVWSDIMVRTYVRGAGEMRLDVTLRDSQTGSTLLRTSDLKRDEDIHQLHWATSVYNRSEAQRALAGWARQLKQLLDAGKGS